MNAVATHYIRRGLNIKTPTLRMDRLTDERLGREGVLNGTFSAAVLVAIDFG